MTMRHLRAEGSGIGVRRSSLALLAGVLAATLGAGTAVAQSLPSVNLGFTSFLDGAPPAGPGLYFQQYLQYYTSDEFMDEDGDEIPLLGDLDVWISLSQLIYQSDQPVLLGGKWGLDLIVPVILIDSEPGDIPVVDDSGLGLGDIWVGPYLQWDPIMGENGPIFVHRIELQTIFPTGKYRDDRVLNAGSNIFSINPYWAGTLFITPRWEASLRFHYLWNSENNRPNKTLFPMADDTQAGQAIHLNFASSYEVLPKRLHAGLNLYYLKQVTDSEVDGKSVSNSREQVLGIGPGAVWHFSPDDHLFLNLYFETLAENRPEGIRVNLRWTHHF
jgi:hypothetical protein